jgi:hypothetical protein
MPVAQSVTVSGPDGFTATNAPPSSSTDFSVPEGGLAFPDFDMRITYAPDTDNVPGSVPTAYALGIGSMPLIIDVHGTSIADLQVNRRALEAAFKQAGQTITLSLDGETEVYSFIPTWPKWGVVNSGFLERRIVPATLAVPVNPTGA